MAEEIRKENGQKFSSGNAYKENQTDFSALLKASKNETIDSPKPQKKEKPDLTTRPKPAKGFVK